MVLLEILQNSQWNTSAKVSFLIKLHASACKFMKEEILVQMFSREFCKISMNIFSYRIYPVAVLWYVTGFENIKKSDSLLPLQPAKTLQRWRNDFAPTKIFQEREMVHNWIFDMLFMYIKLWFKWNKFFIEYLKYHNGGFEWYWKYFFWGFLRAIIFNTL